MIDYPNKARTDLFLRKPQVLSAQAAVKSAQAALKRAQRDLDNYDSPLAHHMMH